MTMVVTFLYDRKIKVVHFAVVFFRSYNDMTLFDVVFCTVAIIVDNRRIISFIKKKPTENLGNKSIY